MKLDRRQTSFKVDEITYLDRKTVLLDRVLLRLFELLRFDGRPPARWRHTKVSTGELVELVTGDPERFPGFGGHEELAEAWLKSGLLQVMNRGNEEREELVGPRPLHLNAYKLANSSALRDYGGAEQVWALIYHADRDLLAKLKEFFGFGVDPEEDRYDGSTALDVETLAILGLVDRFRVTPTPTPRPAPIRPLCTGQGRLLADDLRRLLAYQNQVPRQVLAGYVRTTVGLHLSLFVFRLLKILPAQVDAAHRRLPAPACTAEEGGATACAACPFMTELAIDLTGDPAAAPGRLAQASVAAVLDLLPAYVRAVFLVNRVKDFAALVDRRAGSPPKSRSVTELLELVRDPPQDPLLDLHGFYNAQILTATDLDEGEEHDPVVQAILTQDLPPLERFVEIICHQRLANESKRMVKLIDSLTQKNRPGGFMRQSAGRGARRWFSFDSHLLETLVQIAVVDRRPDGTFGTRRMLLDDFVRWLRERYGFVVHAPSHCRVPPDEHAAWQANQRAFRARLHQIGFYTDLSDAYNSQTLRPRYPVSHE